VKELVILTLVGTTSVAAYLIGARGLRLPGRALGVAAGRMLECVGLTLLFFGANLGVGVLAVLAARALTGGFVSLFLVNDAILLPLSLLQALVFAWWRAASGR
jgi:hypothetical protein